MARIQGSRPRGLFARLIFWFVRKQFGRDLTPLTIVAHHKRVFKGLVQMERALQGAKSLDGRLKHLVELRTANLIGCPF